MMEAGNRETTRHSELAWNLQTVSKHIPGDRLHCCHPGSDASRLTLLIGEQTLLACNQVVLWVIVRYHFGVAAMSLPRLRFLGCVHGVLGRETKARTTEATCGRKYASPARLVICLLETVGACRPWPL